eukprot:1190608-Prorocentrum_minimum.AAC.2
MQTQPDVFQLRSGVKCEGTSFLDAICKPEAQGVKGSLRARDVQTRLATSYPDPDTLAPDDTLEGKLATIIRQAALTTTHDNPPQRKLEDGSYQRWNALKQREGHGLVVAVWNALVRPLRLDDQSGPSRRLARAPPVARLVMGPD